MNPITTLPAFLDRITEIRARWTEKIAADAKEHHSEPYQLTLWFRGHRDASWLLRPSFWRSGLRWQIESSLLLDFRSRAMPHVAGATTLTWWDWMIVAQHHGLPTRLLDWSEGALFGLLFATDQHAEERKRAMPACVWVLNPSELNQRTNFTGKTPKLGPNIAVPVGDRRDQENEIWNGYIRPCTKQKVGWPDVIAIRPPHLATRISGQHGVFTVFGDDSNYLDQLAAEPDSLVLEKIEIAGEAVEEIRVRLWETGTTWATAFPDLDGIAKDLVRREAPFLMKRRG